MINYLTYLSVTGSTWFVLDHIFQYGEKINIKHATFDYRAASGGRHQQLISGGNGEYLRIGGAGTGNGLYVTYGNDNKAQINYILTDNEIELTPTEFDIDGVKVANVTSSTYTWNTNMVLFANTNSGSDTVENQTASVGTITIKDSADTIVAEYIPCLDSANTVCFYNSISQNYIYHTGSGTPIAGPVAHTLTVNPASIKFEASGGTKAFTVTSETGWTCQASTAFTLSTLSGSSGDTIVSVTAANYTGLTEIKEILTITDDDNYTVDVTLRQKKYGAGVDSSLFMGDYNVEALFLGTSAITAMYMGTIEVYSQN